MAEKVPIAGDPADHIEKPVKVKNVDDLAAELSSITDRAERRAFYEKHPALHRLYAAGNFH